MSITEGKWKAVRGAVVTNVPVWRTGYTWETIESEQSYYGGSIVCESCQSEDAALIAQAKERLHIMVVITEANEDVPVIQFWMYWEFKRQIKLALGSSYELGGNVFDMVQAIFSPMPRRICQQSEVDYLWQVFRIISDSHLLSCRLETINAERVIIVSEKQCS